MKAKFLKLREILFNSILMSLWGALCFIFCFLVMLPLAIIFMPINTLKYPVRLFKGIADRFRQILNETF